MSNKEFTSNAEDKHVAMLKAIAPYARMTQQKNVTDVVITHANRKSRLVLVLCPQWAEWFPPFNLCRLSAVAKQAGYASTIVDASIRCYNHYKNNIKPTGKLNYNLWDPTTIWRWCGDAYMRELHQLFEEELERCIEDVIKFQPTVVGFSVYSTNEEPTKWMAQELKRRIPDLKIIVGGSNVQKGWFNKENYYDYVVSGEGEDALLKILEEIESNKTKLVTHIIQPEEQRLNLNNFPMPDYDSIDFNDYKLSNGVTTELSRGCIAKCTFCEETHFWKYRQRLATDILSEVEYLYTNKNIDIFWFLDSLVNGNLKELRAFALGVIAKEFKIRWTGYARCDGRMDLLYLKDLADSGCMILNFGAESGSQRVLNDMDKGVTIAEMEQNFVDCKTVGIDASTNWIVGFPTETYQDYADTLSLLWRMRNSSIHNISVGMGFGQGPETITGQNPDRFNLSYHKYLGHWITKDFKFGGPHVLMRLKCINIFLENIIFERNVEFPKRSNLKKSHYKIKFDSPNIQHDITYEQFDYNIIKANINPFADSLVNEIWPVLRLLWRTRGGYTIEIKFDPELDNSEFGDQHGTGLYSAILKFKISDQGKWSADFKYDFKQRWLPDPYRKKERFGAFFAQDFSSMTSNAAVRARKLAKPIWGDSGRDSDTFNKLIEEEKTLNKTIDWTFDYHWVETGNWENASQFSIELPKTTTKIIEHPLVFKNLTKIS
jgi:hypothetical protein